MRSKEQIINALNQSGIDWPSKEEDIELFIGFAETHLSELKQKSDEDIVNNRPLSKF